VIETGGKPTHLDIPAELRLMAAIPASAAAASLTFTLCLLAFNHDRAPAGSFGLDVIVSLLGLLALGTVIGGIYCLAPTLTLGLIAHALLSRYTPAVASIYASAGAVIGAVCGLWFLLQFMSGSVSRVSDAASLICIAAVCGIASALTFWAIRRPDVISRPPTQPPK
jgi:uncharacterized iron-regulated membrane protein